MYIIISKVISLGEHPCGHLMTITNLLSNKFFQESSLIYDFVESWSEVEQLDVSAFSSAKAFITDDKRTLYMITSFNTKEDCIRAIQSKEFENFTEVKYKLFEICKWEELPRHILPEDFLISKVTIDNIEEFWVAGSKPEWDKK